MTDIAKALCDRIAVLEEWERIADQRGHRLTQIASIVRDNKTALGFDPVCGNEIVDSVLMMRERAVAAEKRVTELEAQRDAAITDRQNAEEIQATLAAELTKLREHIAELEKALAFTICTIKSGEPWTADCEMIVRPVLERTAPKEPTVTDLTERLRSLSRLVHLGDKIILEAADTIEKLRKLEREEKR